MVAITFSDDTDATAKQDWATWAAGSSWLTTTGQDYGVGAGTALTAVSLAQTAPTTATNKDVHALLNGLFDAGTLAFPLPDSGSPIFIVFFPSTTTLSDGTASSCTEFLGYHSWYVTQSETIVYAVIASCAQDVSWNQTQPAASEEVAGHEVLEAASDPYVGGQYSDGTSSSGYVIDDPSNPWFYLGGETADLCVGQFYEDTDAGYYSQRIFSNRTALIGTTSPCLPIPANDLYYNVSPDQPVAYASPGQSVNITLTGWATQSTSDWCIYAVDLGGAFATSSSLADATLNDGTTTTLTLSVPASSTPAAPDDAGYVPVQYGAALIYNEDCSNNTTSVWPLLVGVPPVGQACDATMLPDPCAQYDLACTIPSSGGASCQLPGEFAACTAPVGCQVSGMTCETLSVTDAGALKLCAETCQQTGDCLDLATSCQSVASLAICFPDYCGPGSGLDGGFFDVCDNAGTGDGTCLPQASASGSYGLCYAGGSVATGQACGISRDGGGTDDLCAPGNLCIGGSLPGSCEPMCAIGVDAAADGGPGCASGSDCVQVGSGDFGVLSHRLQRRRPAPVEQRARPSARSTSACRRGGRGRGRWSRLTGRGRSRTLAIGLIRR